MKTIKLNTKRVYEEGSTTKYWRSIECNPQEVELKTWSISHPFFILEGKIVESHDEREIGETKNVYVQTYNFWLQREIDKNTYTIMVQQEEFHN